MKIKSNFLVISNYNNDVAWVSEYTDTYTIYDRSEVSTLSKNDPRVIQSPNVGYNLYDYFTFIIDHYDNLPDCTIFAKGNVFPRHITREYFDNIANNTFFTPIEDYRMHKEQWPVCFFSSDGGFCEINNSWYLRHHKTKYFHSYNDFLKFCFVDPIIPRYIRFAPGANYIVPKANIRKLPKIFYENLKFFISYAKLPGEAHIIERMLHTLWTSTFDVHPSMLTALTESSLEKIPEPIIKKFFNKVKKVLLLTRNNLRSKTQKNLSPIAISEIKEYRKKIQLYDIFTYNGEADMLEIRLNMLYDVVDQFIIVEASTTFSGLHKPLYFKEQRERFAPFLEKIAYVVIDDYPNDTALYALANESDNIPKDGPEHWRREFYQKESIKKALSDLKDDDICFIGDVDEIWNPAIVIDYTKNDIFKLRQEVYTYYLNNKSNEPWAGTLVTKYKNIKHSCLNHLRSKDKTIYTYIENGGWHFTNMGGVSEVRRKLNDSYTAESYNTSTVQNSLEIRFGESDYMGRKYTYRTDETSLPQYVLDNKIKYKELFK